MMRKIPVELQPLVEPMKDIFETVMSFDYRQPDTSEARIKTGLAHIATKYANPHPLPEESVKFILSPGHFCEMRQGIEEAAKALVWILPLVPATGVYARSFQTGKDSKFRAGSILQLYETDIARSRIHSLHQGP